MIYRLKNEHAAPISPPAAGFPSQLAVIEDEVSLSVIIIVASCRLMLNQHTGSGIVAGSDIIVERFCFVLIMSAELEDGLHTPAAGSDWITPSNGLHHKRYSAPAEEYLTSPVAPIGPQGWAIEHFQHR